MTPLQQEQSTVEPSTTFRILVVDDEGLARRMMTRALGAAGHFCASTGSGVEAIELLELQQFDLAVVDKNLPDVSGLEVTRRARGLARKVPVIVVTGFPSNESEREARRLGASRYMVKPFETSELQREVREVLRASWGSRAAAVAAGSEDPSGRILKQREVAPLAGAPEAKTRPTQPARRPAAPVATRSETDVAVLIVENDARMRTALVDALTGAGCRVVAFQSRFQAEVHVRYVGYDVLVARPEVLREASHWEEMLAGSPPLGALAIVESGALTERVNAIQEGAVAVLVPPFEPGQVVGELRSALVRMREKRKRTSVPPRP